MEANQKRKKKTINAYHVYCLLQELCKASILGRASHASVAVSTQRNDCVVKFASTDCANAHTHIYGTISKLQMALMLAFKCFNFLS